MIYRLAIFVVLSGVSVQAQKTWHGLSFGDTEDQITKKLAPDFTFAQKIVDGPNSYQRELDHPFVTTGATHGDDISFQVAVTFSKTSKTLQSVFLALVIPSDLDSAKKSIFMANASRKMYEDLVDKYGTPTRIKGHCPLTVTDLLPVKGMAAHECTSTWKSEDQLIELNSTIVFMPGSAPMPLFGIHYKPVPTNF